MDELIKENTLLKQYTAAIQRQNQARNNQREVMMKQIERLELQISNLSNKLSASGSLRSSQEQFLAKEVDRLMREGQKFRTEATTYKNDYERSQKEIVVLKESTQSMVGQLQAAKSRMDLLSSQVQNKETELAALRKDLSANASKLHAEHALKLSQYENELKICRSKLNEFEVQAMKLRHTTQRLAALDEQNRQLRLKDVQQIKSTSSTLEEQQRRYDMESANRQQSLRIDSLQSSLRTAESNNIMLQKKVKQLQGKLLDKTSINTQISQQQQQLVMMGGQVKQLEQSLRSTMLLLGHKDEQIRNFGYQLAQKDQSLRILTIQLSRLEETNKAITSQTTMFKDESAIAALSVQLTNSEQFNRNLQAQMFKGQEKYYNLQLQLLESQKVLKQAQMNILLKERQMAAVEGLVANLKEDKGQLERMVAEQKEVIAQQKQLVAERNQVIVEKDQLIANLQHQNYFLKQSRNQTAPMSQTFIGGTLQQKHLLDKFPSSLSQHHQLYKVSGRETQGGGNFDVSHSSFNADVSNLRDLVMTLKTQIHELQQNKNNCTHCLPHQEHGQSHVDQKNYYSLLQSSPSPDYHTSVRRRRETSVHKLRHEPTGDRSKPKNKQIVRPKQTRQFKRSPWQDIERKIATLKVENSELKKTLFE